MKITEYAARKRQNDRQQVKRYSVVVTRTNEKKQGFVYSSDFSRAVRQFCTKERIELKNLISVDCMETYFINGVEYYGTLKTVTFD